MSVNFLALQTPEGAKSRFVKTIQMMVIGLALMVASVGLQAAAIGELGSGTVSYKYQPPAVDGGPVIAVQPFGVLETPDLDQERVGVGLGLVLNVSRYLGAEVEAYSFREDGSFVDRLGGSLRYNILTGTKSRPYVFGGGWHDFEEDATGIHLGVGLAHQFARWFTPFADVRFHKALDGQDTSPKAIVRAGLSIGF